MATAPTTKKNDFPKELRLLKSRQFRICERYSEKKAGKYLAMQLLINKRGETKLGITVSRRYGNAVMRNRFKRRVRETFRQAKQILPQNSWIHIKPLCGSAQMKKKAFLEDLRRLLGIVK